MGVVQSRLEVAQVQKIGSIHERGRYRRGSGAPRRDDALRAAGFPGFNTYDAAGALERWQQKRRLEALEREMALDPSEASASAGDSDSAREQQQPAGSSSGAAVSPNI